MVQGSLQVPDVERAVGGGYVDTECTAGGSLRSRVETDVCSDRPAADMANNLSCCISVIIKECVPVGGLHVHPGEATIITVK